MENKNTNNITGNINIGGEVSSQIYINKSEIDIQGIYEYVVSQLEEISFYENIGITLLIFSFILPLLVEYLFGETMIGGIVFFVMIIFGAGLTNLADTKRKELKAKLSVIIPNIILYYPNDKRTIYIDNLYWRL